MTSTVITPSRRLAAGCRRAAGPRRSGPAVLSLKGPRRLAPSTSCSAVASPEKRRAAAKLLPPQRPSRAAAAAEKEEGERTDYNEVAAALESIYKLSPAVVEEKHGDDEGKRKGRKKGKGGVVRSRCASCSIDPILLAIHRSSI